MFDVERKWLINVAIRKVVIKGVTMILAWLASGGIQSILTSHGITYDPMKLQVTLTGTALAGLKAVEDFVNFKYGWNI